MLVIDSASRARLRTVYPDLAVRWRQLAQSFYESSGRSIRVQEAFRTMAYQAQLYAQGRTAPGKIVTYSKPGDSLHHYGLAIDSCFVGIDPYLEHDPNSEALWREYGRHATAHGLSWGGAWSRFIDRPHVQMLYGLLTADVKELYSHKGLSSVWAKCDQMRGVAVGGEWYGPQASTNVKMLTVGQMPTGPLESENAIV